MKKSFGSVFVFALILILGGSVWIAHAELTLNGTTVSGDGNVFLDGAGTISIGTSTASGVTIGRSGMTTLVPGFVNLGSTTISGQATTTNLSITSLAGSSGCLSVNASGLVATTTCSGSGNSNSAVASTTIWISQIPGIHQNTNLVSGGGTDDTLAIQTAIDNYYAANPNGSLALIQDGASLITGLTVPGNFLLYTFPGDGFFMQASSPGDMITNKHHVNVGTPIDQNISIIGGIWNDNGNNQAQAGGVNLVPLKNAMEFGGITNLVIRDVTIENNANYGIWLWNWKYVTLDNDSVLTSPFYMFYDDAFHLNGPGEYMNAEGLMASGTTDDVFALNADDVGYQQFYSPSTITATSGPITEINLDGLKMINTWFGVRLLSNSYLNGTGIGSRIDGIFLNNISGYNQGDLFNMDGYGGPGNNNVGNVDMSNVNVNCHEHSAGMLGADDSCIYLNDTAENLNFVNITKSYSMNTMPLFHVGPYGNVKTLSINGLHVQESTISAMNNVLVDGTVNQLLLSNLSTLETSAVSGSLIKTDAAANITQAVVSDAELMNTGNLIDNQGTIESLDVDNATVSPTSTTGMVLLDGASSLVTNLNESDIYGAPGYTKINAAASPAAEYGQTSAAFSVLPGLQISTSGIISFTQMTGTQCLHEVNGVVSGTGSDCGAGGGGGSGNLFASPATSILANNGLFFQSAGSSTVAATSSLFSTPSTGDITIGSSSDNGPFSVVSSGALAMQLAASDGASMRIGATSTIGCIEMYDGANSSTLDYLYVSSDALVVTQTKPSFCQ